MTQEELNKKAQEMGMYGCTAAAINQAMSGYDGEETMMLAMSILSDAQMEMSMGNTEIARQLINRAKYVISKDKDRYRAVIKRLGLRDYFRN